MNPLVAYLLKMTLISGVLYAYYHAVLKDKRFHQWNRFYLLSAVALSILIPFFHIPVQTPEQDDRLLFKVLQMLTASMGNAAPGIPVVHPGWWASLTWQEILTGSYGIIVLVLISAFAYRLWYIRKLHRRSPKHRLQSITLIETREESAPFSFFQWIFWNQDVELGSREGEHILRHELTHVNQRHSWDKVGLQLACICFFPVIFFYLIRRELQIIHEYLADKQAIGDRDIASYAEILIGQAMQTSTYDFANHFFQHPLKRRIAMMTSFNTPRFTYLRKVLFLPLALGLFGILAFRVEARNPGLVIRLERAAGFRQATDTTGKQITDLTIVSQWDTSRALLNKTVMAAVKNKEISSAEIEPVPDSTPNRQHVFIQYRTDRVQQKNDTMIPVTVMGYAHESTKPVTVVVGYRKDSVPQSQALAMGEAMFVVDGGAPHIGDPAYLQSMDVNTIQSITVLKNPEAVKLYGPSAVNGVILINTKKVGATDTTGNTIYTVPQVEATFPGGDEKWNDYMRELISNQMNELRNDNKQGTCEVQFIVDRNGKVSDVHAFSMQGSVLATLCVDAIKNGPDWVPAKSHGVNVKSYRRQKIIFELP